MGNARILWNSNTLTLEELAGYEELRPLFGERHVSDGAVVETVRTAVHREAVITLEDMDLADDGAGLLAWWAWASRGNQYAIEGDSAAVADTTISANATAGDGTVFATDASAINTGDALRLSLSTNPLQEEIVSVRLKNLLTGELSLYETLKFTWPSGATLRAWRYFPAVVAVDERRPWIENPARTVSLIHHFREVA